MDQNSFPSYLRKMNCRKNVPISLALIFIFLNAFPQSQNIRTWLTNKDRSSLFEQQKELSFSSAKSSIQSIVINDNKRYQTIDGFGFALTGGSAMHIIAMSAPARTAMLKELFATDGKNIGISYLRLSIGASDLNEKVFSYDDVPEGKTDTALQHFDLGPDRKDVIPVLKEILQINPRIKILGSPWSPPAWMKTNQDSRGGRLKPEYSQVYANYFVKYIQQMKAEGITIDAITVQNEPLHPGNNPSLLMTAPEQAGFIKNNLGPAFEAANIKTHIIVYDHNADRPDYPISIYNDPEAARYVSGAAFHLYNGSITALTDVHNAYPDKDLYFTEQMVVEPEQSSEIDMVWPVTNLVIGATLNWSKIVLEWNLAADPQYKPYTDRGGCDACQGAITIDKDNFKRNIAYYVIAHASKFVRPGSVRIASSENDVLANVAFKTPEGKVVQIVCNTSEIKQSFNILYKGRVAAATLKPGSVATYIW